MESDLLTVEDLPGERADARDTLMVLLDRLVRENGAMGTADKLGVNYKTLAAALETRRLSRRMTHVLEIQLLSEDNPVLQQHDDRIKALDERMDKLEDIVKQVVAGAEGLQASVEANRAEQDRVIRILERRINGDAPVEPPGLRADTSTRRTKRVGAKSSTFSIEAPEKPTRPRFPRRDYDEIVTIEPTPDDSYVYGKAWPLVREWRMLRRNHPAEGRTLSWMQRRERLLKVEIALLNEHRLTLPPDAQPIDDQWRRHVTNWRINDLRVVRRRIVRRKLLRWVRRLATFGLWWG